MTIAQRAQPKRAIARGYGNGDNRPLASSATLYGGEQRRYLYRLISCAYPTEPRPPMTTPHETPFPDLEELGGARDYVEEIQEILKTQSIFEGFSAQESALLCDYMECYGAPSRSAVLREGDRGDFLIVILTGRINVVKSYAPGDDKVIAQVGPGDFLGEMALFDDRPRFASCLTTEPTDFAVLTRDALNDILIDHPRLGNKLLLTLLQRMTERLRDAVTRMLPTLPGSVI